MEPVSWFIGLILIVGGVELWDKNKGEEKNPKNNSQVEIVSNEPVYSSGRYYLSEQGYYITDLSSEPISIEGCDDTIYTADLSKAKSEDLIDVVAIDVPCGG